MTVLRYPAAVHYAYADSFMRISASAHQRISASAHQRISALARSRARRTRPPRM